MKNSKVLKLVYLLSITLLLLLWFEQRSINAYWIQTYHKASPLSALDRYSLWRTGSKITDVLNLKLAKVQDQLTYVNEEAVTTLNNYLVSPTEEQPIEDQHLLLNTHLLLKQQKPLIIRQSPFIQIVKASRDKSIDEPLPLETILVIHKTKMASNSNPCKAKKSETDSRILIEKDQKVFFVGDSLMQGVAPYAMRTLLKQHGIESINLSKQSTGLSYPRFFNWPEVARDTFAKNADIKLMVVFMGPNDPWDFPVVKGHEFFKFTTPEWEGVYRARIQSLINAATSKGAHVLWIGAPNMRDKKLNQGMITLNKIYQSQVTIAGQRYTSSNDVLGMKDHTFVKFMNIPNKGNVTLRTGDGIHFTIIGQKRIADKIISLLRFTDATETTNE